MSETYYIVKEAIKTKYKERYGINNRQKGLISAIFISVGFGFLSFYKFSSVFGKVFLLISIISLVYFYYKLFQEAKVGNNEPMELIVSMKESLATKNINSINLISLLQEEIVKELLKKENELKVLFKRISVVFVSIFWLPFAFLTKYFIEQYASNLTWEGYVSLSGSLLIIATQLIGVVIAMGNQFENFMSINKKDLLLTNRYLNDIKYLYIMEEDE